MTAPVVYGDLWVAHKGARGPRLNGGTAPWPSRPPIHWLRLPRVRLVMHVLNCARHRTARPKSSRHVDELLHERLAHRGRPREDTASDRPYTTPPQSRHVQVVCPPRQVPHG